jgi:hypothetical protein
VNQQEPTIIADMEKELRGLYRTVACAYVTNGTMSFRFARRITARSDMNQITIIYLGKTTISQVTPGPAACEDRPCPHRTDLMLARKVPDQPRGRQREQTRSDRTGT